MIFDLPLNTSVLTGTNVDARLTDLLLGHCSSPNRRANVLYIGEHFYGELDSSNIKFCDDSESITLERYTLIVINKHGSYYNNGVVTSTLSENYCTALSTLASLSIPFLCVIS